MPNQTFNNINSIPSYYRNDNDNNNNNEEIEEGSDMANKKIETSYKISFEKNQEYKWIGFELNGEYYIGLDNSEEIHAIIVSKKFFQAFEEEFGNDTKEN